MRPSAKTTALVAVDTALHPTGFVRRGHVWHQERGGGVRGWLCLSTAGSPAALDVTPLVGVCFTRFDTVSRALGVPPAPLLSLPLGFLMPEKPCWRWTFGRDGHEAAAQELVGTLVKHGQPFVDRLAKWDAVVKEVLGSEPLLGFDRPRKLAIIHAINGEVGKALAVLGEERERIADSTDSYARAFRVFVHRFGLMFSR
ncbi:hypothetical protein BBK82_09395 [Lentzea guizhouensis]|uniref:Uncharacterized protein n=1 Tax=Lentzea guizhouensis TaxID=1586287 RepID=A0A1B2HEU5_9PSEU|nr:hypothetical protein [Lentzea guizhouensis]ANZ36244.1 hypothetical protein BBK82_09395 [Lentzea guizhouensis]